MLVVNLATFEALSSILVTLTDTKLFFLNFFFVFFSSSVRWGCFEKIVSVDGEESAHFPLKLKSHLPISGFRIYCGLTFWADNHYVSNTLKTMSPVFCVQSFSQPGWCTRHYFLITCLLMLFSSHCLKIFIEQ